MYLKERDEGMPKRFHDKMEEKRDFFVGNEQTFFRFSLLLSALWKVPQVERVYPKAQLERESAASGLRQKIYGWGGMREKASVELWIAVAFTAHFQAPGTNALIWGAALSGT